MPCNFLRQAEYVTNLEAVREDVLRRITARDKVDFSPWIKSFYLGKQRTDQDRVAQPVIGSAYQYAMDAACRQLARFAKPVVHPPE